MILITGSISTIFGFLTYISKGIYLKIFCGFPSWLSLIMMLGAYANNKKFIKSMELLENWT